MHYNMVFLVQFSGFVKRRHTFNKLLNTLKLYLPNVYEGEECLRILLLPVNLCKHRAVTHNS